MSDLPELSVEQRQQLEQICDQFESQWRKEAPPDLQEYAERLRGALATVGLAELVILDAFYRRQSACGDPTPDNEAEAATAIHPQTLPAAAPLWSDYVRRFPQLKEIPVPEQFAQQGERTTKLDERFQHMRAHAAGGLGRVSIAEDVPFARTVAVKEMHGRFAESPEHRKRFLREARITGQLEHPSIVPVYAMGNRASGEPYYVMRMIHGRSLLEEIKAAGECDGNRYLNVERRKLLRRFMSVCQAVEFAHNKGVIHRDIKPDNIMLGDYGETLLVDWGLAKQLGEKESNGTRQEHTPARDDHTQAGTVLGTPAYMSPEQAAGDVAQIDRTSDVYSLGATLRHLLSGQAPTPAKDQAAEFNPSAVPQPLKAICLKAMAQRPQDRYPSAQALADDIELALADDPVSAYRDPLGTRIRRWIQRHRTVAAAGLAGLVLMLVGSIVISSITRAHANALAGKNQQLDNLLAQEKALRQAAETSEQRASKAMNYLVTALRSPDPNRTGREVKVADVLDRAVAQLDQDFGGDPLMLARMLNAVGLTYFNLSMTEQALPLAERAYEIFRREAGEAQRTTLSAGYDFALILKQADDPRAADVLQDVLAKGQKTLGKDDHDVLKFEQKAAVFLFQVKTKTAIERLEALLPRVRKIHGEDSPAANSLLTDLATGLHYDRRAQEAAEISKKVFAHHQGRKGPDALDTIRAQSNYVRSLQLARKSEEALVLLEELLPRSRKSLGDDHHQTLIVMNNLATSYLRINDPRGLPLVKEAYDRKEKLYGPEHHTTLVTANSLGTAYLNRGDYEMAIAQYKQTYDILLRKRGPAHQETLTTGNNLANAYRLNKQYPEAIELFKITLATQQDAFGKQHPDAILSMLNLAATLQDADQTAESIQRCREVGEISGNSLGKDHPFTQTANSLLGIGHLKLKRYEEALQALQAVHESRRRTKPDHWIRFHSMSLVGEALLRLKRLKEAEPLLVQAYQELKARENKIPQKARFRLDQAKSRLADLYDAQGKPEKAKMLRSSPEE